MRKRKIALLALLLSLGWAKPLWADFQVWTELKYSHTFPDKKLTLLWSEENRFFNNASDYGLFATTLGFDYRVLTWLRPGFYQRVQKKLGSPSEVRLVPQVEFLAKLGPIQFEDRNRFEIRIFTNDDSFFRYRNRVKFTHTFKTNPVSFTPYVSDEIYLETKRNHNPTRNRAIVGNGFGFAKNRITFDVYYLLQSEKKQKGSGWTNDNVLGTSLGFKY